MKIVQIISSLEQGGAEKLVVDMANTLVHNHEVYIITFKNDDDKSNLFYYSKLNKGVNYINLKFSRGIKFKDVVSLSRQLKRIKPDVIHCHLHVIYHTFFYSFLTRKVKSFHTIHNDAEEDCLSTSTKYIRRFWYRFKIYIPITISQQSKDSFNRFYKLNNSYLIYNGTQTPKTTNNLESVKTEISELKTTPEDKVFVHVSRFYEEQKNHSMLIRNINRLRKENFNLILLVIGKGYDSEEAQKLKSMAGKGIYFLGSKSNVPDYLTFADAFCLSSNYEGMPISLLEALGCGCVPICTPVGGIKDLVKDGKTGYLSEDVTQGSYYKALKRFLQNDSAMDKKSLSDFFQKNFTIEKCVADHEVLYTN